MSTLTEMADKNLEHLIKRKMNFPLNNIQEELKNLLRASYIQGIYDAHVYYQQGEIYNPS